MGKHSKPVKKSNAKRVITSAAVVGGTGAMALGLAAGSASAFPGQDGIIKCESGGNPTAQNATTSASGLFQIVNGTWAANGGLAFAPTAKQATPAQQQIVADRIYARSGTAPWVCKPSGGATTYKGSTAPKAKAHVPAHVAPAAPTPAPRAKARVTVPSAVATGTTYTVRPGDTLSQIAATHGLTGWHSLATLNRGKVANPNLIFPGQVLQLPS